MIKVEIKKENGVCLCGMLETQELAEAWVIQRHEKDFEVIYTDVTLELAAQKELAEALQYLASTDWYCIREFETGKHCPEGIKLARAAARLKV